jgi:hypothetical protein
MSNVNALSINENLSMLADYHDREQRRFNRTGGQVVTKNVLNLAHKGARPEKTGRKTATKGS